jgi:hypothetical protein
LAAASWRSFGTFGMAVGTATIVGALATAFVLVLYVNNGNNQHGFGEKLRIGYRFDGMNAFIELVRVPF